MKSPKKTHATSRRQHGLSRNEERTACGRIRGRCLGVRFGPEIARPGVAPTCKRCRKLTR